MLIMTRILVMSDTHGDTSLAEKCSERTGTLIL